MLAVFRVGRWVCSPSTPGESEAVLVCPKTHGGMDPSQRNKKFIHADVDGNMPPDVGGF